MANKKITELPELTSIADNDLLYVVDVSDLTESADGTSKKIRKSNIAQGGVELIANKQNSLVVDGTGVKYPTVDTINAEVVKLTGNQTIAGTKTFSIDAFINGIRLGKGNNSLTENTVLGLASGGAITTGDANTLMGYAAGNGLSSGSTNSFFGNSAGRKTTTGSSNTFVGGNSGFENTTGSNNNFIGGAAGFQNTIGSANTYIGVGTGWYIADGVTENTNSNNSVLIGNSARVLADNQTNQIVIGQAAIGLGSNSVVIGNTDTVVSNIKGRLLLGTTTNNGIDQLQVNGTVNLTTPTTSAGGYDILTRNSTSGQVEKIASTGLAPTASPTFTGTPIAPTATSGTNTTQIATTAFVLANSINIAHLGFNNTDKTVYNYGKGGVTNNISFGQYTMTSNTSGQWNTSIGSASLLGNTSGSNNTALGYRAGSDITGGRNLSGNVITNGSIYIGDYTRANASGQTNQIVIGTEADGNGSNTVTLGNDNIVGTYLKGKVITNNVVRLKNYTVATLPAGVQGDTTYVTDALAPTYMTTIVGGGAVVTPVFYNGTNWVAN